MDYKKITETPSDHNNLELMDTQTILQKMNEEDKKVALAVEKTIPQVTKLVDALAEFTVMSKYDTVIRLYEQKGWDLPKTRAKSQKKKTH